MIAPYSPINISEKIEEKTTLNGIMLTRTHLKII